MRMVLLSALKARLVALGCRQIEGFDFHDTYAPVTKHATVRTLLALATVFKFDLHHADVSSAFSEW